jgi:hypothetical protein
VRPVRGAWTAAGVTLRTIRPAPSVYLMPALQRAFRISTRPAGTWSYAGDWVTTVC